MIDAGATDRLSIYRTPTALRLTQVVGVPELVI